MAKTLKEKTAQGILWGAVNNGTMQVLNLVFGLVLGRLLSPGEYGIVGVLTIFTVIAGNLQSSGFSQGLINLRRPTSEDYNSVFWFNITASVLIYGVLFAAAPLIAAFFRQPVLVVVSRVTFLSFVISAFGIAQNAYMTKQMMQREIAISSIAALLVSGSAGIALALMGASYWSLVCQQLLYISVLNIGRYHYSPWRPSWRFTMAPVRGMLAFSVKILLTNILNTLSQQMLTFIFGRLFPISTVGNFSQANKWATMAGSTISGTLGQVAQTVMVEVESERERERRVFRKMLRLTAFLTFPALFALSMVSREFLLLCLGDKWAGAVPLMQVLCVGGAFLPLHTLYQNLAISNRRSDLYLWCNTAQMAAQLAVVALCYSRGVMAVVWATTVLNMLWLGVWQAIGHHLTALRHRDALADTVPFMAGAAGVMGLTGWLTSWISGLLPLLVCRCVVAAGLYLLLMKVAGAKILDECIHTLRHKIR